MDSYEDGEDDEDGEDQEAGVMAGRGTWAPAPSLPRHPPSALLWAPPRARLVWGHPLACPPAGGGGGP